MFVCRKPRINQTPSQTIVGANTLCIQILTSTLRSLWCMNSVPPVQQHTTSCDRPGFCWFDGRWETENKVVLPESSTVKSSAQTDTGLDFCLTAIACVIKPFCCGQDCQRVKGGSAALHNNNLGTHLASEHYEEERLKSHKSLQ